MRDPEMHNTWGLSRVGDLHLGRWHVHGSNHEGMVLFLFFRNVERFV